MTITSARRQKSSDSSSDTSEANARGHARERRKDREAQRAAAASTTNAIMDELGRHRKAAEDTNAAMYDIDKAEAWLVKETTPTSHVRKRAQLKPPEAGSANINSGAKHRPKRGRVSFGCILARRQPNGD